MALLILLPVWYIGFDINIRGGHYYLLLPVLFHLPNLARFQQRPARVPASLLRLWLWCGPGLSRQQGTRLITLPQHSQPSLAQYTHHTADTPPWRTTEYLFEGLEIQKIISIKKLVSALQYA